MSFVDPSRFTTRPEIQGTFGVVASTHWIATAVGMGVLERGGNAFDAGVATAFALQIVEPHLNGPGGDIPIMVHDARRDRTEVICGQGPAPAGATLAHYRSLGLDLVPGTGLLAPCVPGTFDALLLLLRDYGSMRLADVLAPAIGYARDGHPLLERASATIASVRDLFLAHWPTSAGLWLERGEAPGPGTLFRNIVLAETYARIVNETKGGAREAEIDRARRIWSEGFVAEAIDRFCRTQDVMDVSGRAHRGVLSGADMAKWSASVEQPIGYDYGRYRVLKPGPWCQGLATLQQLALLKGFPFDGLDPTGPDFVHWQVEAAKLAFADRDTFYGDPDFVRVPVDVLLSDDYNNRRRSLIGAGASFEQRPGSITGFGKAFEVRVTGPQRETVGAGEPTVGRIGRTTGDTVHFDVIDREGNMVAATPSGGWLQSSPTIPELGFCLGTRAQMFVLEEGHPILSRARQASTLDALAHHGDARWGALPRLGDARRRPAGPVDSAVLSPACARGAEPAGIDRRSRMAHGAFSLILLASRRKAGRPRRRRARSCRNGRGAAPARASGRGRSRLVGRAPRRRRAGSRPAEGRGQSPRHAGLCGRAMRAAQRPISELVRRPSRKARFSSPLRPRLAKDVPERRRRCRDP